MVDHDPITIGERFASAFIGAFFGSIFGMLLALLFVALRDGTASAVFIFTTVTMIVIGFVTPRALGDLFAMFTRTLALLTMLAVGAGAEVASHESKPREWIRPFSVLVLFLVFVLGLFWVIAR